MFIKISQNVCKDFRKCFLRIYKTAESTLWVYCVDCGHFCLKLGDVIGSDFRAGLLFPREGQQVFRRVQAVLGEIVTATERCHDVIGLPTGGTPHIARSAVVASDNASHFPPAEPSKCVRSDADFAHEQCIELVGGCQFFAFSPSSSVCSAASSAFTTSGTWKNSPITTVTML